MPGVSSKPACSEPGCGLDFRTIELLRNHIVKVHGLHHPEEVITFQTDEGFNSWKDKYEAENLVNFRQYKKYPVKDGILRVIHRCNRCYKPGHCSLAEVKKGRKATGSLIMDVVCTCTFIVCYKENEIQVNLFPSHYNHDLGKSHKQYLKIPKAEKEELTKRLKAGVPRARVIQDIRDEYFVLPEEDAQPKHYASAHTIYNLSRDIDDQRIRKARDDHSSMKKWVADRPDDFIYTKFQYEIDEEYPVSL